MLQFLSLILVFHAFGSVQSFPRHHSKEAMALVNRPFGYTSSCDPRGQSGGQQTRVVRLAGSAIRPGCGDPERKQLFLLPCTIRGDSALLAVTGSPWSVIGHKTLEWATNAHGASIAYTHERVIVGDPQACGGVGAVFVYPNNFASLLDIIGPSDYEPGSDFGACIVTDIDINGDHCKDAIIAAPHWSGTRHWQGQVMAIDMQSKEVFWRFSGENSLEHCGVSMAALSDQDDDGVADLLIGSPGGCCDHTPETQGSVQLVSGLTGQLIKRIADRAHASGFGMALAALGSCETYSVQRIAVGAPYSVFAGSVQILSLPNLVKMSTIYSEHHDMLDSALGKERIRESGIAMWTERLRECRFGWKVEELQSAQMGLASQLLVSEPGSLLWNGRGCLSSVDTSTSSEPIRWTHSWRNPGWTPMDFGSAFQRIPPDRVAGRFVVAIGSGHKYFDGGVQVCLLDAGKPIVLGEVIGADIPTSLTEWQSTDELSTKSD